MEIVPRKVTHKIVLSHLLLLLFSLIAIVFALTGLHSQTRRSQALVAVEVQALNLSRQLRGNLLAQDGLEKQFFILENPEIIDLLDRRQEVFLELWQAFSALPPAQPLPDLATLASRNREEWDTLRGHLGNSPATAEGFSRNTLSPLRDSLIQALEAFRGRQEETIHDQIIELSTAGSRAFRLTLLLVLLGIAIGTPVVLSILLHIHRSISRLSRATETIGSGDFDFNPAQFSQDEFGLLAGRFHEMGMRLKESEERSLDANPLTRLPGNLAIERELEKRISTGQPFAHALVDLDHFKVFNDRYGYQSGSEIIAEVGEIVRDLVSRLGNPNDLVGHIGGDDYVILSTPERMEGMAAAIIEEFDRRVPGYYSDEDRTRGFFLATDRFGVERQFSLMSMSIAIVCSENFLRPSAPGIAAECARMKDNLKNLHGSNFLMDRRKGR